MRKQAFEKIFLWLFIPLSLLMLLVMPITRTPDEPAHLQQAFIIADGQLLSSLTEKRVSLPENLLPENSGPAFDYGDMRSLFSQQLSPNRYTMDTPTATAIYPPFSYFPQALCMALCMLLTDNLGLILYSARLGNYLCIVLTMYAAARLMPRSKRLFAVLALLPMNLQQMISASADGMAIALVYLLTAFVLHCMEHKPRFTWKHRALLFTLGLTTWCFKMFYSPMVFLLCFIPVQCFASRRQKVRQVTGAIAGGFGLMAAWALTCYLLLFSGAQEGLTGQTMANLSTFFANPADFLVKLAATLKETGLIHLASLFGYKSALSWFNIMPGLPLTLASMALVLLAFILDDAVIPRKGFRLTSGGLSVLCTVLVFLMLYLWWTPAESLRVEGFQSRYLLPLLLPLGIACKPRCKQVNHQWLLLAAAVLIDLGYLWKIVVQV